MAAGLEVLTGTSYNPYIGIGKVINVKVSKLQNSSFVKEDYGKFACDKHRASRQREWKIL